MKNVLHISVLALCLGLSFGVSAKTVTTHKKKVAFVAQSKSTAEKSVALPTINVRYKCKDENGEISYQEKQQDKMECWLMTLNEIKKLQIASLPVDAKTVLSPTEFIWARDKYTDSNLVVTHTPTPPSANLFPGAFQPSKYVQINSQKVNGKTQITLVDEAGKKTILNADKSNVIVKEDKEAVASDTTRSDSEKTANAENKHEISPMEMLKVEHTQSLSLEDLKKDLKNRKNQKNIKNQNLIPTQKDIQWAKKLDEMVAPTVNPIASAKVDSKPLDSAKKLDDKTLGIKDEKKLDTTLSQKEKKSESPDSIKANIEADKHDDKSALTTQMQALPIPKGFKIDTRTE